MEPHDPDQAVEPMESDNEPEEIDTTPWEVHVQEAEERQKLEQQELEAIFKTGPIPDWISLPDTAWEIIIEALDSRNPPSGARNLFYALISCKRLLKSESGVKVRALIEGRVLRVRDNDNLIITAQGGEVNVSMEHSERLIDLCETVSLGKLEFGSAFLADDLLLRPKFKELHAERLIALECALQDLSILANFPRLESLHLRQRQTYDPPVVGILTAEQLAVLGTLPRLKELAFHEFACVPLLDVDIKHLDSLMIQLAMLEESNQDAFQYTLPRDATITSFELCGPSWLKESMELGVVPYDTPIDLFTAAQQCQSIRVQCVSLVLEDKIGEFLHAPEASAYVIEALRRGSTSAWRNLQFCFTRGMWAQGSGNQLEDSIHLLTDGNLEPIDIDVLRNAVVEALGPRVSCEVSRLMHDGVGMCTFKVYRE